MAPSAEGTACPAGCSCPPCPRKAARSLSHKGARASRPRGSKKSSQTASGSCGWPCSRTTSPQHRGPAASPPLAGQ
eukprot:1174173-Pyramimonas_sp.AAC.1